MGMIFAGSPQAKGRVERVNRTFQDRLVKELALVLGITTITDANRVLEKTFSRSINALIRRTPASGANVHQALPRGITAGGHLVRRGDPDRGPGLVRALCEPDLQVHRRHQPLALAGRTVEVLQRADGTLESGIGTAADLHGTGVASGVQGLPKPPRHSSCRQARSGHPWNQGYKGMLIASRTA